MPTYEYKREDGTVFDYLQKMSDAPLTHCPDTGQKVSRIISGGGGVVYKGEGWYVKEYKNSGKPAPTDKPAESSTTKTESSTTETAPKVESKPAAESSATA